MPILDFIHALSYVYAAAHAGRGPCGGVGLLRPLDPLGVGRQVAEVMRELQERQAELGSATEQDKETSPGVVVGTALTYLRNNAGRMKYDEYRQQGLPITSSYVERAVKQFNRRVKGTEKFWSEAGAEALLQLRADYLSDDRADGGVLARAGSEGDWAALLPPRRVVPRITIPVVRLCDRGLRTHHWSGVELEPAGSSNPPQFIKNGESLSGVGIYTCIRWRV